MSEQSYMTHAQRKSLLPDEPDTSNRRQSTVRTYEPDRFEQIAREEARGDALEGDRYE